MFHVQKVRLRLKSIAINTKFNNSTPTWEFIYRLQRSSPLLILFETYLLFYIHFVKLKGEQALGIPLILLSTQDVKTWNFRGKGNREL